MPDSVATTSIRGRPRTSQRNEFGAGNAAVAVGARFATEQPECLGDGAAFGLQVVGAPQDHRHRLGQRGVVGLVAGQQAVGLKGTVAHARRRWGYGMDRSRADCGRWEARRLCEADRRRARGGCSRHPKHAGSPELRDPQPVIRPAAAVRLHPLRSRRRAWTCAVRRSGLRRRHAGHAGSGCIPVPAGSTRDAASRTRRSKRVRPPPDPPSRPAPGPGPSAHRAGPHRRPAAVRASDQAMPSGRATRDTARHWRSAASGS